MVQPPAAQDVPGQSGTTKPFTKDQIEQIEQYCQILRQMSLNPPTNSTVGSCSVTQSGMVVSALSSQYVGSWIVDSGASEQHSLQSYFAPLLFTQVPLL